jgi:general secretion pathway protein M
MLNQLNPRERVIVISGAVILLLILLYLAVISPYRNALARLDNQVAVRSQQLKEVEALLARYQVLQKEVRQVERLLENRRTLSTTLLEIWFELEQLKLAAL